MKKPTDPSRPLFHRLYGVAIAELPPAIVALHDTGSERSWRGLATVERGDGMLARAVCWFLGFPPSGIDLPLTVTMRRVGDGEHWFRRFGAYPLNSRLAAGHLPGTIVEHLGPLAAISRLDCDAEGVTQVMIGLRVLGVAFPRAVWPKVDVRESAEGRHRYRFSMQLRFPWRSPLIHYHGIIDVAPNLSSIEP